VLLNPQIAGRIWLFAARGNVIAFIERNWKPRSWNPL